MHRDALVHKISSTLAADDRVRGAWLSGSLGRGDADLYSDVDVWISVEENDRDAFIEDWPATARSIAPYVLNEQVGRLPVFNVVTEDWLRFDIAIGTIDDASTRTHTTMKKLFDKDGLESQFQESGGPLAPNPAVVTRLVKEFFRVLGLLPVVCAREEYSLAVSGAGLLRTLIIQLMLEDVAVEDRGGALHLKQLLPADRYTALAALPPMVADRESALATHLACADIFLPLARELSDRIGNEWPQSLENACRAHLERELKISLPGSQP